MAFSKTPVVVLAICTLLWRCSARNGEIVRNELAVFNSTPPSQLDGHRQSSARPSHQAALLDQHSEAWPENGTLEVTKLPEVTHKKKAGRGYSKGSPYYRKQKYWESLHDDKHNADKSVAASDNSTKALAAPVHVVEPVNMSRILLAYIFIVVIAGSCLSSVILRSRTYPREIRARRMKDEAADKMKERLEVMNELDSSHQSIPSRDVRGPESKTADGDVQGVPSATTEGGIRPRSESGLSSPLAKERSEVFDAVFAKQVNDGLYFTLESETLVETMGLSGMSLLEMDANAGISDLPLLVALPACAFQAWFLQAIILFYMTRRVTRLSGEGGLDGAAEEEQKDVPFSIIFAAIYLHFINCMNDLPFAFSILKHIGELHEKRLHLMIAMPTFMLDGLIIPFTSLFVGAFYLCTSLTVSDVILNSCAVAFISNIDNWILALNEKLNKAAAVDECAEAAAEAAAAAVEDGEEPMKTASGMRVFIPVDLKLVQNMSWWMCVVPIVPSVFSAAIGYAGLEVLKL